MPSTKQKPNVAMRRAPRGRRLAGRELTRALEPIERKYERPNDEPADRGGRGIVEMPGRLLADGTRKGARVTRRVTLYLPLEIADELFERARRRGLSVSNAAGEALGEQWGIAATEPGAAE